MINFAKICTALQCAAYFVLTSNLVGAAQAAPLSESQELAVPIKVEPESFTLKDAFYDTASELLEDDITDVRYKTIQLQTSLKDDASLNPLTLDYGIKLSNALVKLRSAKANTMSLAMCRLLTTITQKHTVTDAVHQFRKSVFVHCKNVLSNANPSYDQIVSAKQLVSSLPSSHEGIYIEPQKSYLVLANSIDLTIDIKDVSPVSAKPPELIIVYASQVDYLIAEKVQSLYGELFNSQYIWSPCEFCEASVTLKFESGEETLTLTSFLKKQPEPVKYALL